MDEKTRVRIANFTEQDIIGEGATTEPKENVVYGATQKEWQAFMSLDLESVNPVVCDPRVKQSENSRVSDPTKTPSLITADGCYVGKFAWATTKTRDFEAQAWAKTKELGISLVARRVRAIDIDIEDADTVESILNVIRRFLGEDLYLRSRANSNRVVVAYTIKEDTINSADSDVLSEEAKQATQGLPIAGTGIPYENEDEEKEANKGLGVSASFIKKEVINTKHGAIEFLFDRQQFICAGMHKSGARYEWNKLPSELNELPSISFDNLQVLAQTLNELYGTGGYRSMLTRKYYSLKNKNRVDLSTEDAEAKAVFDSEYFIAIEGNRIILKCPWAYLHNAGQGDVAGSSTATVYFPATPDSPSKFDCKHVSHGHKSTADFLEAIGYVPAELEDLSIDYKESMPSSVVQMIKTASALKDEKMLAQYKDGSFTQAPSGLTTSKGGDFLSTIGNLVAVLSCDGWMRYGVAFDTFKHALMIRDLDIGLKYRLFEDVDYTRIRCFLEVHRRFARIKDQDLKQAVLMSALDREVDVAKEWIESLDWDGKDRISTFASDVLRLKNSAYADAVFSYLWSAMAARIITPGIKADMIPVLIGAQGIGKSTLVASLAPFDSWRGEIDFSLSDADKARITSGKCVIEAPELKGFYTHGNSHNKAWLSRTTDEWIPKFKEFAKAEPRRFMVIGTTNNKRFLSDQTGNRRYLPVELKHHINVKYLRENVEQLWAQAKVAFLKTRKISWALAEELAKSEVHKYVSVDAWEAIVKAYTANRLKESEGQLMRLTSDVVIVNAIGKSMASISRQDVHRVDSILTKIGFMQNDDGSWQSLI